MGCSRAEVGYIKMELNKALEHMLLGTALVRIEETRVQRPKSQASPSGTFQYHLLHFTVDTELS